jgi:hypothetical protein
MSFWVKNDVFLEIKNNQKQNRKKAIHTSLAKIVANPSAKFQPNPSVTVACTTFGSKQTAS